MNCDLSPTSGGAVGAETIRSTLELLTPAQPMDIQRRMPPVGAAGVQAPDCVKRLGIARPEPIGAVINKGGDDLFGSWSDGVALLSDETRQANEIMHERRGYLVGVDHRKCLVVRCGGSRRRRAGPLTRAAAGQTASLAALCAAFASLAAAMKARAAIATEASSASEASLIRARWVVISRASAVRHSLVTSHLLLRPL